jgi:von Willebrand factor type A domain
MACRGFYPIFALLSLGAAGVIWGCSAGGSNGDPDGQSSNPSSSRNDPSGSARSSPIDIGPTFGDEAAERVGCSQLAIGFESRTPTALIVVDRSSSQWDNKPNNTWEPMKAGILQVVSEVQKDIRVGMVTYTGQNGGVCPDLYPPMNAVSFDKNNFARVQTDINAVGQPNYKGETPTAATLQQALPVLLADPSPGDKVMLLVTDGDPDFCNDPDRICSMDAVIGAVQDAYAKGVRTTVFGLKRAELSEQHLRDVANAGSGQPVAFPQGITREEDLRNRCRSNPAGTLPGTYAPVGGNAQYFQANGTDTIALGDALNAVIFGIRSCVFDLAGAAEINPANASSAHITLDNGAPLVFNDPNGWQLRTATQVELLGSACQQIKMPTTSGISFDFPCDALIPR